MPARSVIRHIRVIITSTTLEVAGTDGDTAGVDTSTLTSCTGLSADTSPFAFLLRVEDGIELDRLARQAKKAVVSVTVTPATLTFSGTGQVGESITDGQIEGGDNTYSCYILQAGQDYQVDHEWRIYDALDDLMEQRFEAPINTPLVWTVNPKLWTPFGKIKTGLPDRMADVYMNQRETGTLESLLIKIGPTFVGLLMPINRPVYTGRVDELELW